MVDTILPRVILDFTPPRKFLRLSSLVSPEDVPPLGVKVGFIEVCPLLCEYETLKHLKTLEDHATFLPKYFTVM